MWFKIRINDMKIASKFVSYMKDLTYETILHSGKYSVDAKSILGLTSLASHPIKVVIHSDDLSEIAYFKSVCEKYEVKE